MFARKKPQIFAPQVTRRAYKVTRGFGKMYFPLLAVVRRVKIDLSRTTSRWAERRFGWQRFHTFRLLCSTTMASDLTSFVLISIAQMGIKKRFLRLVLCGSREIKRKARGKQTTTKQVAEYFEIASRWSRSRQKCIAKVWESREGVLFSAYLVN